jgi:predicted short-subunit dehydrogenase-like oxidoreductase (DUF2520 family)
MSLFGQERRELAIGVVGAGRVGGALALALARSGWRVVAIASRRIASAEALAELVPGARACLAQELVASCRLIFLALPDGALAAFAEAQPWRAEQAVVHTSGALGLDALAAARTRGALVGCLHPLQAFPAGPPAPERLRGATCGIEGPPPLAALLRALVVELGARPLALDGVRRAPYHAAAVFASNYAIALLEAASEAWRAAGLPEAAAREALSALLAGAVENARALPLARALSGPVARGDADTVARHLDALAPTPELASLYRALGARLLRLDLPLEPAARARLAALLT